MGPKSDGHAGEKTDSESCSKATSLGHLLPPLSPMALYHIPVTYQSGMAILSWVSVMVNFMCELDWATGAQIFG